MTEFLDEDGKSVMQSSIHATWGLHMERRDPVPPLTPAPLGKSLSNGWERIEQRMRKEQGWHAYLKWNSTMLAKVRKTKACAKCLGSEGPGDLAIHNAEWCTVCLRELLSAGYALAVKGSVSPL